MELHKDISKANGEVKSSEIDAKTKEINVKAFLRLIRYAEHHREDDGVYYLLFGGKQKFTDTRKHPNMRIRAWGTSSDVAGAYQIKYISWSEAKKRGILFDFTPASQDKYAIWRLKTRGALEFIEAGEIEKAISKSQLRKEWTSLPGAKESNMKMSEAIERFEKYKKELWDGLR